LEHAKWELTEKLKANPHYQDQKLAPSKPSLPKLPIFKEGKDDIDAFLFRFENHAKTANWPENQWAAFLSTFLEGSALSTYHCLAATGALEYETLKKNLLVKFRCTAERFRERFRAARPVSEEGFSAFEIRLRHLMDRWLDLSGTEKSFNSVVERMLCEQFMHSVSKDLAMSLGERLDVSTATLKDLVQAADRYRMAHPDKCLARLAESTIFGSVGVGGDKHSQPINLRGFPRGHGFPRNRGGGRGGLATNNSTEPGRTGQQLSQENLVKSQNQVQSEGLQDRKFPTFSGQCHYCSKPGHKAKDCWTRKRNQGQTPPGQRNQSGNTALILLSAATPTLPVVQGFVNGKQANVLRDTGATCAGVKRSLVKPSQFTGEKQRVTLFGGKEDVFPLASVWLDSPFYKGQLLCVVIDNPVADVILGNVDGVVPSVSQVMDMVGEGVQSHDVSCENANVLTRAQMKREQAPTPPLKTGIPDLLVDKDTLIDLQKKRPISCIDSCKHWVEKK
jgi:hypothetical protein